VAAGDTVDQEARVNWSKKIAIAALLRIARRWKIVSRASTRRILLSGGRAMRIVSSFLFALIAAGISYAADGTPVGTHNWGDPFR